MSESIACINIHSDQVGDGSLAAIRVPRRPPLSPKVLKIVVSKLALGWASTISK